MLVVQIAGLPSVAEMWSKYLFGTLKPPVNLLDDNLIRPLGDGARIAVDASVFMSAGPGRFVNGYSFSVVQRFFDSNIAITPRAEPYSMAEMASLLGILPHSVERGYSVQTFQSNLVDGQADYAYRVQLFQTTWFFLGNSPMGSDIEFVVEERVREDGTHYLHRSIRNFVIQRSSVHCLAAMIHPIK